MQHHKSVTRSRSKERENLFSNGVLIGNWFEERFANTIDRKAITPGVCGESQCSSKESLYRNDFQQPKEKELAGEYNDFVKWKQEGFGNYLNCTKETNIHMWDGDEFVNNITTLNDVMFRLKPQQDVESMEKPLKKKRVSVDYMRSYGNSTNTGLLYWLECKKKRESEMHVDGSHYKAHFKPIKITEPRILHKAMHRKTSI